MPGYSEQELQKIFIEAKLGSEKALETLLEDVGNFFRKTYTGIDGKQLIPKIEDENDDPAIKKGSQRLTLEFHDNSKMTLEPDASGDGFKLTFSPNPNLSPKEQQEDMVNKLSDFYKAANINPTMGKITLNSSSAENAKFFCEALAKKFPVASMNIAVQVNGRDISAQAAEWLNPTNAANNVNVNKNANSPFNMQLRPPGEPK